MKKIDEKKVDRSTIENVEFVSMKRVDLSIPSPKEPPVNPDAISGTAPAPTPGLGQRIMDWINSHSVSPDPSSSLPHPSKGSIPINDSMPADPNNSSGGFKNHSETSGTAGIKIKF